MEEDVEEEERMRTYSTDSTSAHPEVENIILNYSTVALNKIKSVSKQKFKDEDN